MTVIFIYSIFPIMANHRYKSKRKHKKPSPGKESYYHYLQSDHWQQIRIEALKLFRTCVLCGSKNKLNVHHRNYKHLYQEIITEDLIVLCKSCHEEYHNIDKPKKHKKGKFRPKNDFNEYSLGGQIVEAYRKKQLERQN